jgi:lipoyl(octanoyl) transferase
MNPWRLIINENAYSGVQNMALDEALLLERLPEHPPILRLYQWDVNTLSLGRFQKARDVLDAAQLPLPPVVRRVSSGGAILHRHDEITYSIIAPYKLFGGRSPKLAYHDIHDVFIGALEKLGIALQKRPEGGGDEHAPFCYNRLTDFDLTTGEDFKKLIGSAQHRRGRAFLQHGSIPLKDDGHVENASSISRILGRDISRADVITVILEAFKDLKDAHFENSSPSTKELEHAQKLKQSRYGNDAWTYER